MLTDIETLQKELETFHNNVKQSNELSSLLSNIITALNNEEKMFAEKMKALEDTVSSVPEQLKTGNQDLIQRTLDEINRAKTEYENTVKNYLSVLETLPKTISDNSEEQYTQFLSSVKKEHGDYVEVLREAQAKIDKMNSELENKYNAFLAKMESTNMDQIYKVCLDMDKKINNKLTLILVGVAAAIILSIVAIIL